MCSKKTRKIFEKILTNINGSKIFNTKLGKRKIDIGLIPNKSIYFIYYDKDDTELFHLGINKNGRINIYNTKIGKPEIFLAIYEIENIINNNEQKKKDVILEKLFENICDFNFQNNIFGFTMYR